jgi:hypothetical protein
MMDSTTTGLVVQTECSLYYDMVERSAPSHLLFLFSRHRRYAPMHFQKKSESAAVWQFELGGHNIYQGGAKNPSGGNVLVPACGIVLIGKFKLVVARNATRWRTNVT